MVDFSKYSGPPENRDPRDLLALYKSHDPRSSHTELRPAQVEALQGLSTRLEEPELLLKLSTGAGKTTIGLIYLEAQRLLHAEPVIYLCPTVQLVNQVLAEAENIGAAAVAYPAGESIPPAEGTAGQAIIVCTYDKMFNGRTSFNRSDVDLIPSSIVLDDVHAGIEEVRDAFRIVVRDIGLIKQIKALFHEQMKKHNFAGWDLVCKDKPHETIEVPYWILSTKVNELQRCLQKNEELADLRFSWPHLREVLRWCRVVVGATRIEITPLILPVHNVRAYWNARNKLFMSATLADDSALVRELGCKLQCVTKPVAITSDRGMGERMVLAPSLIDKSLDRDFLMKWARQMAETYNCVVLAPSDELAREWETHGAHIFSAANIENALTDLRGSTDTHFYVLVKKYDGVDLPDDACRILILDGLPYGQGLTEIHDSSRQGLSSGHIERLTYRVEQGMGRAVRSHSDYAVVILAGPELANFVCRHEVTARMNKGTKLQLNLALDIARFVKDEGKTPATALAELIRQCLRRDRAWKQFYEEKVRRPALKDPATHGDINRLSMADAERNAFDLACAKRYLEAARKIGDAINAFIKGDEQVGWHLQTKANYLHENNPGEALQIQQAAFEKNRATFCPQSAVYRAAKNATKQREESLRLWCGRFENPNAIVANLQEITAHLSFANPAERFERGLLLLGEALGAESSRPEREFGEGPDNLWYFPDLRLLMEAKNENENSLHASDAGQLHRSVEWFKRNYPAIGQPTIVTIARERIADAGSNYPKGTRVITENLLSTLLSRLEQFFIDIANQPLFLADSGFIQKKLFEHRLHTEGLISNYTESLKELSK